MLGGLTRAISVSKVMTQVLAAKNRVAEPWIILKLTPSLPRLEILTDHPQRIFTISHPRQCFTAFSPQNGLYSAREAARLEKVQVLWRRPLTIVALCPEAILHECRDQMFPDVDGTELDHLDWFRLCGDQCSDVAVVLPNIGSGLPAVGVRQLGARLVLVPDI